ncbi:MAG: hypothetical protein Edafosvirus29_12 [Edafosvirus sp.]|uniref:Uncharacterized protein n=1 Tax=Edafosvirus sp. TaxID=2487765 RepID=A0A3G4ZV19_9VIRU|nr:MAG: hypothetical protein Edafosvirus29_12 [Edafosvirus sp.]
MSISNKRILGVIDGYVKYGPNDKTVVSIENENSDNITLVLHIKQDKRDVTEEHIKNATRSFGSYTYTDTLPYDVKSTLVFGNKQEVEKIFGVPLDKITLFDAIVYYVKKTKELGAY